jgi:hypothetical protein
MWVAALLALAPGCVLPLHEGGGGGERPDEALRIEPEEPGLPEVVRLLGAENLLFGSDYPHADHGDDIVDHIMSLRAVLSAEVLCKLLWDNPARFYGLGAGPSSLSRM